jgi:hypothetical protein
MDPDPGFTDPDPDSPYLTAIVNKLNLYTPYYW